MNRQELKVVAAETLAIIKAGYYTVKGNTKRIDLSEKIRQCVQNTKLYGCNDKCQKTVKVIPRFDNTHIEVKLCSTLEAVQDEIHLDPSASVAALNFASAKNPGGGFLNGSQAQEESIARTSALYECLISEQAKKYYSENEQEKLCLYTDNVIYSPNVPVFRSDRTVELLDQPYECSIITSPAVNFKIASKRVDNMEKITQTFSNRADKLLAIAFANNADVLILGAWGTGVFGCPIAFVAQMFRQLLIGDNAKYKNAFRRVIFAIYDKGTCESFDEALHSSIAIHFPSADSGGSSSRKPRDNSKSGRRDGRWKKHAQSSFSGDGYSD